MDERRRIRSPLAAFVAALLVAACGAAGKAGPSVPTTAASPVPPATPLPTARINPPALRPAGLGGVMLALGRPGEDTLRVVDAGSNEQLMTIPDGAADPSWRRIVTVVPDGAGTGTQVQEVDITSGTPGSPLLVPGRWRLPTIGGDAAWAGRSTDGATLVLVPADEGGYGTAARSRFLILRQAEGLDWSVERTLDLKGAFDFDTLSPDGSFLYVVEHLDATPGGHYAVRSIDLASGTPDPQPIANKILDDEPMAGVPITQLRRPNGFVLTLYRGPDHPFVHLLSSADKWAICIDLPATGAVDAAAARGWGLAASRDGQSVYAVNASLGLVAEIGLDDLSVRRTARIVAPSADAAPAIVLAKFGHDPGGPVGRHLVATADGRGLVAGGRDGLTGIATKDLSTTWRALPGAAIRAIALSANGDVAFALLASGQVTAVSTADGSVIGSIGDGGYDRLLAIAG